MDPTLLNKLEEVHEELQQINVTLAIQKEQLKAHMKRSELNEKAVEMLAAEFKPVQQHVVLVNTITKMTVTAAAILGAVASIIRALH